LNKTLKAQATKAKIDNETTSEKSRKWRDSLQNGKKIFMNYSRMYENSKQLNSKKERKKSPSKESILTWPDTYRLVE
jgi:hypothetical protein